MQEENGVYFKLIMIKMVITNKIHLENKQNAMASGVFFIPSIVAAALMCIPSFWRRAEIAKSKEVSITVKLIQIQSVLYSLRETMCR